MGSDFLTYSEFAVLVLILSALACVWSFYAVVSFIAGRTIDARIRAWVMSGALEVKPARNEKGQFQPRKRF